MDAIERLARAYCRKAGDDPDHGGWQRFIPNAHAFVDGLVDDLAKLWELDLEGDQGPAESSDTYFCINGKFFTKLERREVLLKAGKRGELTMPTQPTKEPRILFWDIESTGLRATFATILCIGWKFKGETRVTCPGILDTALVGKDMLDDKALVQRFVEAFNTCDYHVTWYGERFDKKMISAKLIRYKLPPLAPKPHLDLWKVARKFFNLHSNRLAVWQQYLGVEHEKTPLDYDLWRKAGLGHRPSLVQIKHHCRLDVLVLEEVFDRMRPWIDIEPARRLFHPGEHSMACVSCGSHRVTKQGLKRTKTRAYQQFQCQECGKWMRARTCEKPPAMPRLVFHGDES